MKKETSQKKPSRDSQEKSGNKEDVATAMLKALNQSAKKSQANRA